MAILNTISLESNKQIKTNLNGGDLSSDGGLLLVKEFAVRIGLVKLPKISVIRPEIHISVVGQKEIYSVFPMDYIEIRILLFYLLLKLFRLYQKLSPMKTDLPKKKNVVFIAARQYNLRIFLRFNI